MEMTCTVCNKREADPATGVCTTCHAKLTTIHVDRPMGANEYQHLAQRTSADMSMDDKIINGAMGLAGEAGEVIDHVKKWRYQNHEINRDELIEEVGDVLWYVAQLCEGLGIGIEEAMRLNIDKLMRRYPDGFDAERSVNR